MTEEKDVFNTDDLSDIPDDLGVKEYFEDDDWDTKERIMRVFVNYHDKYQDEYDGREISLNTITISYYRNDTKSWWYHFLILALILLVIVIPFCL